MSPELTRPSDMRASIFAALADPARLRIVDHLLAGDASPSELQRMLAMPSNLVAHHLKVLETASVVRRARSEGDRRRTYLSVNVETLESMLPVPTRRADRVVFVCTQNSARSQLAVAIWNRATGLPAASAGTRPANAVHPGAISAARRWHLQMRPQPPTHLDDVFTEGDLVVAVCDNAHEELPAGVPRIHWSIPDPVAAAKPDAFDGVVAALTTRIDRLVPSIQPSSNGAA